MSDVPIPAIAELAHVFERDFPDSIQAVRAVRNAIAHGKSVEDDDLRTAYEVALALEEEVTERIGVLRSALEELRRGGPTGAESGPGGSG